MDRDEYLSDPYHRELRVAINGAEPSCCECDRTIIAGEQYECAWGEWEGDPWDENTCNSCLSLWHWCIKRDMLRGTPRLHGGLSDALCNWIDECLMYGLDHDMLASALKSHELLLGAWTWIDDEFRPPHDISALFLPNAMAPHPDRTP